MLGFVKLCLTTNALSIKQYHHLWMTIIDSFDKKFLNQLLFDHFKSNLKVLTNGDNNEITKNLQTIAEIANDILHKTSHSNTNKNTRTIDELPKSLIGHCSSFLCSKDYNNLQLSNRHLFIACNSPITMHEVNINHKFIRDNSFEYAKLNKYRLAKVLKLELEHFKPINTKNTIWNNLDELSLKISDAHVYWRHKIKQFIESNVLDFSKISKLRVVCWVGKCPIEFSETVAELIRSVPNIEILNITTKGNVQFSDFAHINRPIRSLKLKCLQICQIDSDDAEVIQYFATPNLVSLDIDIYTGLSQIPMPPAIDLAKLEELQISMAFDSDLDILNDRISNHLKRIAITPISCQIDKLESLTRLFKRQSLEYIHVDLGYLLKQSQEGIIQAIIRGISINFSEGKQIQIKLVCIGLVGSDHLFSLISILMECYENSFILRVGSYQRTNMQIWLTEITKNSIYSKLVVTETIESSYEIAIMCKECKINQFHNPWKYIEFPII